MQYENNQKKHCFSSCDDTYICNERYSICWGRKRKKTFTITVNNAKAGHTYEAYQILKGDLSKSETTLSNVGWGSGIQEDKQTDLESNKDAKAYVEKLSGMQSNSSDLKAEAQKLLQL